MLFDKESDSPFPRLRVDTNDSLVSFPYVGRVDGQVGDVPVLRLSFGSSQLMTDPLSFETFFDGVLMRARESGVNKFTCVWVARMDGEVIALYDSVYNGLYVT